MSSVTLSCPSGVHHSPSNRQHAAWAIILQFIQFPLLVDHVWDFLKATGAEPVICPELRTVLSWRSAEQLL